MDRRASSYSSGRTPAPPHTFIGARRRLRLHHPANDNRSALMARLLTAARIGAVISAAVAALALIRLAG